MNKKFLLQFKVCIFTGMSLLAGCSSQEEANLAADTAAINDIWDQSAASLNAGDLDRWISFYTEDALQMRPNEPLVIGKDQIWVWIKDLSDQVTFNMDITNTEVEVAGDWAFSLGTYTVTMTPKEGGQPVVIDAKYIEIFTRQPDGSWKKHREIFNRDAAPGGE